MKSSINDKSSFVPVLSKVNAPTSPWGFLNYTASNIELPPSLYKDDSISVLDLPIRLENTLKKGRDIRTVGQFCEFPEEKFKRIKNIGDKSINYLLAVRNNIEKKFGSLTDREKETISPETNNKKSVVTILSKAVIPTFPCFYLDSIHGDDIKLPPFVYKDDPLSVLGLPTILENTLRKGGNIRTVGQFCEFPINKLGRIKNIGDKSIRYLLTVGKKIDEEYGPLTDRKKESIAPKSVVFIPAVPREKLIDLLLTRCATDREKDIIRRRYGLTSGDKVTLEEIGQTYGVTRERIRQIQKKALGRMKHPATQAKGPLIESIEQLIYENCGLITDEEADLKVPTILNGIKCDGSSLLDLMSDLKWIQSYKIGGEIKIYSPFFSKVSLEKISKKIITLIKEESLGINVSQLSKKLFNNITLNDIRLDRNGFIFRYCSVDPRIEKFGHDLSGLEEVNSSLIFKHYTSGHFVTKGWVLLMKKVLEEEQSPLHFTEISNKVNDFMCNSGRKIDLRRIHCLLIENKEFAHTGIRGTYGLTIWGIRKETTPELVGECLRKAGFPLHWKQIYNYVSKYKDSKPGNIISILKFNRGFKEVDSDIYWFREE